MRSWIYFTMDGDFDKAAVSNGSSGFNTFTENGEWTGFLVPVDEDGSEYLHFDEGSEWVGLVV